jgi:hypothetical protein
VDGVLKRGSRRAAADQYWTTQNAGVLGVTTVGSVPWLCKFDGLDVWVANQIGGSITRVRASDGRLLETWTGLSGAVGVIAAMGRILAAGSNKLVMIDPSQAAGAVTTVATNVPANAAGLAFDGLKVWVAGGNSVSIATPSATIPWTVTTVTAGFGGSPVGVVYDGANIWVTNINANTLVKLDSTGAILQTVTVGSAPEFPVFDGTNIWVPNDDSPTVTVVRASNGAVLATLTGNGLGNNFAAAFDGQRVLVTSSGGVSLWKAADLTPLGSSPIPGAVPFGACSDGINFWITLQGANKLARF